MDTPSAALKAPKTHESPRISLNKLGEYLQATPTRRKSIVRDQKKPPGAGIVTRYGPVTVALREYFKIGDKDLLTDTIGKLMTDQSGSDWQREDRQLSARALERVVEMLDQVDLTGAKVVPFPSKAESALLVGGVKVSVRPDFLVVLGDDPNVAIGALKLSHNKQNALDKLGCEYIAIMLARFVAQTFPNARVNLKRCLSLATPLKVVATAPKSYKAKSEAIDAACEEIAGRWKAA